MVDLISHLDFKASEEDVEFARENSWVSFVPEFAEDFDGNEFMRAQSRPSFIYKVRSVDTEGNRTYECTLCSNIVANARVVHPIQDGVFNKSGGGKAKYEEIPYCPVCEDKPVSPGSPIIDPLC